MVHGLQKLELTKNKIISKRGLENLDDTPPFEINMKKHRDEYYYLY